MFVMGKIFNDFIIKEKRMLELGRNKRGERYEKKRQTKEIETKKRKKRRHSYLPAT